MVMTPEESRVALAQAIHGHAVATNNVPVDDAMLSTFAVVAHWVPVEDNGREGYSMHYSSDTLPQHVVLGLLQVGAEVIAREIDDE